MTLLIDGKKYFGSPSVQIQISTLCFDMSPSSSAKISDKKAVQSKIELKHENFENLVKTLRHIRKCKQRALFHRILHFTKTRQNNLS